jgi:25S rRNA (uracil2843-N3)-methyltransferase
MPGSLTTQQKLLKTLENELKEVLALKDLSRILAQIKQLFFNRDFLEIFTNDKLLDVYTLNYVPSRMLCYLSIFDSIIAPNLNSSSILCLGAGNGAELLGIVASTANPSVVHISDLSKYSTLDTIVNAVRSEYTQTLDIQTSVGSVLDTIYMDSLNIPSFNLITTNFLLNEILTGSKRNFVILVKTIVESLNVGSYWLVVDAASDFSQTSVGSGQVMIYKLLDCIKDLEIVHAVDSEWFRPDKGLEYPLKIQSMRYFARLYRKV